MTTASDPRGAAIRPNRPRSDEDRVALVWNGLAELTARLDGTEDAVAAALDTLTAAVADLKSQLTALLAKEREKDVPPRRWADRATGKDWDPLIGLGRSAQRELLTARRLHHPAVLARAPRRRRRPRRPAPRLDDRRHQRRTRQTNRQQQPHRLARPLALALPAPHEDRALPHHQLPGPAPGPPGHHCTHRPRVPLVCVVVGGADGRRRH